MDFKKIVAVVLIVITSHVCIHEVVIAMRCYINALGGVGRYSDMLEVLGSIFLAFDSVTFDRVFKAAATNNNPTASYHILVRIIGFIILALSVGWLFMLDRGVTTV